MSELLQDYTDKTIKIIHKHADVMVAIKFNILAEALEKL